jgi:tetratricopeptide (TPR) repeat protein
MAHAETMFQRDFLPGARASEVRAAMLVHKCNNPLTPSAERIDACKDIATPGDPGALDALADAYRRDGNYADALSTIDRAISEVPHENRTARTYFTTERAVMVIEQGDRNVVQGAITQIAAIEPDSQDLYANRCWLRAVAGVEMDQALEDCNKAIATDPKDYGTMTWRALVHLKLGHWDACVMDANEARKHNSQLSSSLYMRGYCEDRMGDHAGAAKDVESAKSFDPGIAELLAKRSVPPPQE